MEIWPSAEVKMLLKVGWFIREPAQPADYRYIILWGSSYT